MANFDFIVDADSGRLLSSFTSTKAITAPDAVIGDKPTVSVRIVEGNNNNASQPWRDVDLTGQTIRVAIGDPGSSPTAGTYTLTFGADTTAGIAYNASAADVQTALNGLASITAAGDVTVTAYGDTGYRIEFGNTGDQDLMTADADGLAPTSSVYMNTARAGDGSNTEVQILSIERDSAAYVELTADMAAPSASITVIRDGVTDTTSELQRITISGTPYQGTYTLTIGSEQTGALEVDSDLDAIKAAVEALASIGAGKITVTGSSLDYTLEFDDSLGNVGAATADITNLTGPVGKTGTLDLNTTGMIELLDGSPTKQATLEIVRYTTSTAASETVLQAGITCRQDVIPDTPPSATPLPAYASTSATRGWTSQESVIADKTLDADDMGKLFNVLSGGNIDITNFNPSGTSGRIGFNVLVGTISFTESGSSINTDGAEPYTSGEVLPKGFYVLNAVSNTWTLQGYDRKNTVRYDASQALTDAQVRQANANLRSSFYFNVKYFGAKGDGVTDDTDAIQSCKDAADAAGASMFVPAGTYLLDLSAQTTIDPQVQSLNLHEGSVILGEGKGRTIFKLKDTALLGMPVMLAPSGDSDSITLQGFSIDGNFTNRSGNGSLSSTDGATGDEGINLKSSSGSTLRDIEIYDMGQDGADLDDCFDYLVQDCYFHDNWGNGLHAGSIVDSGRGRVIGCRFERNGFGRTAELNPAGGMDIKGTYNVTISDCVFVDNAHEIYASRGTFIVNGSIFLHNREENSLSYDCVNLYGDGTFTNCIFSWSKGAAIKQQLTTGGSGNGFTSVDNCYFYCGDNSLDGYHCLNGQGAKITNSYFQDCNRGVFLESKSDAGHDIDIDGNRFKDCPTAGIEINDVTGGSITNNRISGGNQGIYFTHAGATGWRVCNNPEIGGTYGVRFAQYMGGANHFEGNYMTQFYSKNSPTTGAVFKNNHIGTIWLNATSGKMTFEGNTIDNFNTTGTTYLHYHTWKNNDGAAVDGVLSGSATLVAGTVTVSTIAIGADTKIRFRRDDVNSSTALGELMPGSRTAGTSFEIDALQPSTPGSVETGDLSDVIWEFVN